MRSLLDRILRRPEEEVEEDDESTTHALTWVAPERSGTAPTMRNGHTANLVDSRIYIFGGGDKADLLNDMYVFDVRDHSWSQPPCTGVPPPPRSRHSSAVIDRSLYIWGGIGGGMEVHVLDTMAMDWSAPTVHGPAPDSRFGHTCVAVDVPHQPRLFILGGHNSRQPLSDVHILQVTADELTWERPSVLGEAPICGNRHATVLVEDASAPQDACLLVFAADMHDTFGMLYALRYRDGVQGNGVRWIPQPTAGKPPLSRARPSVVLLDQHVFVICGVAAGKPLSTVAMLNVHTYVWSTPNVDGMPPPARMGASATRAGTDIYIFGGNDGKSSLRDLHLLVYVTWFTPVYGGRNPPARVGHTCSVIGSKLYLLGGASRGQPHNDLYVLDPTAQQWTRPPMYGTPPDALVGHSTVAAGNELVIWGGGDGKRAHASLNIIDTANMLWSRPPTTGSQPHAHVGHSAVHLDAKMILFGGYGHRQYWNELVVLDTGIMVWMRPHTSGVPPDACVCHTATLVGQVMIIYGGAYDEVPIDQLIALDIPNMRWNNIGNYVWDGPRPAPRFGHGTAAIGNKLFVFGGTTGSVADTLASYLVGSGFVTGYAAGARNELVVMDLEARTFSMPRYAGQRPPPSYRVSVCNHRGKIFVFGGVGSDGHLSLLDTGFTPPPDADADQLGEKHHETTVLDAQAAAAFTSSEGGEAQVGRRGEARKGLDATKAAELVALLQDLGLNKYARLFLRQEIDVDSLLQLSDADLKDMGLSALGARRKLTAAIHRHRLQRQDNKEGTGPSATSIMDAPIPGGAAASSDAPGPSAAGDDGEGRPLNELLVNAGEMYRDRYKLGSKTYIGGSARVVLGEDLKTGGKPVAIKVHSSKDNHLREVKLLKHLASDYIVQFLDSIEEEGAPPAIVLEGGTCSLSELLAQGQLSAVERKLVLERLCLAVDFVHSKGYVLVDLKPQNIVIFGSLLTMRLIDLECLRKNGESVPFKLTPFYAAPELAAAALETMRLGQLPPVEYDRVVEGGTLAADQWGPNLARLALLSENPTLARAVAAASIAANRAGDRAGEFNRDEQKQLDAPLKMPNGKPLRASTAMDVWSIGLIAFELFTNESFFSGCSDDVALQVLASQAPLELPTAQLPDEQAQHLLAKILVKRPKERASVETILKHAYLVGGLDTQQVGGSFAKLHESQVTFQTELKKLQEGLGGPSTSFSGTGDSFANNSTLKRGERRARFSGASDSIKR